MAACVVAILGTHSRGDLLAAIAGAYFLGVKSRRPVLLTIVFAAVLASAALFMPDNWTQRMETIETYQQDASAMSRLQTWHMIWNMVLHRPIVGAGFDLANPVLYQLYGVVPNQQVLGPHSIYMQALGEHGFVGLALYLALGVAVWWRSGRLAARCKDLPEFAWVVLLMRMSQVSLVIFAVGGAFLGLLHYDLPYYVAAIVVLTHLTVAQSLREAPARARSTAVAATPEASRV
jgi:probable O-glycosylation ligase (exosortase A-associated)